MNRKPIYNTDRTARLISLPSNRGYVFQRLGGGEGNRTFDPWYDDSKPLERTQALARLATTETKKEI